MIQSAAYGGNVNGAGFGGTVQGSSLGDRMSAAGGDPMRGNQPPMQDSDRSRVLRNLGASSFPGNQSSQLGFRGGFQDAQQPQQQQPPIGQPTPQPHMDQNFSSGDVDSITSAHPESRRLSQMSELDRFGLAGLLAMIPGDSHDHSSLAVGQDLTVLGLDLNRPDNSPLYPTFGTPFVEPGGGRPVIPEFTLPPAYTVNNVPPLHTKITSFADETLFAIFYQFPRDVIQEVAAQELYNRDWRWHKELRQWMMKDNSIAQPIRVSEKQERGLYIFFDVNNWRRERV
ncbi:hypothetical protein BDY21DRAFT_351192 [Lineolata rhizophorae]|uniref:NOT2/NOT3/NOT5 C-terminal domain-containing protein n=1 Tax=Lineolata rhizophorae TaxID=578093 RepID=A0A6A6NUI1_9PEZI|nr:hypothetical protein BDY21DRAFT_351192 [Lineolata rhizophorae]